MTKLLMELADKIILLYTNPKQFEKWLLRSCKRADIRSFEKVNDRYVVDGGHIVKIIDPAKDPITNFNNLAKAMYEIFWNILPDYEEAVQKLQKWWKNQQKRISNTHKEHVNGQ